MRQSFVRFLPLFACAAIVAGVSVPTKLLAQDRPRGEWDLTLGGGAAVRPTYEGSDHYIASPVPFVNVIWRDTISLGVDGLSAYWRYENLRVGGGLTYATGRYQSSGIFQQGDGRLAGMGDIPGPRAQGLCRLQARPRQSECVADEVHRQRQRWRPGEFRGRAAVQADGVHNGEGIRFGRLGEPELHADLFRRHADAGHQFRLFPVQCRAGIKDVNFGVGLTQQLGSNWALWRMPVSFA